MKLTRNVRRRLWFYGTLAVVFVGGVAAMVSMPGSTFRGKAPPLTEGQTAMRERMRADVLMLASTIGERNAHTPRTMEAAAQHIESRLRSLGLSPTREPYRTRRGDEVANVIVSVPGRTDELLLVGAHYDTALVAPGADDNASGVAVMLALIESLRATRSKRTLRFIAFANEEPPSFWTEEMGSLVHARAAKARGDRISAMLSLESLGLFRDEPGTQKYPPPIDLLYPSEGNFVAFVGDISSRALVRRSIGLFRATATIPSEGAAFPQFVSGVGWSDHWSFWQVGVPALMVTDTAVFRSAAYHTPADTPDKLDYDRMARVATGLVPVVTGLADD